MDLHRHSPLVSFCASSTRRNSTVLDTVLHNRFQIHTFNRIPPVGLIRFESFVKEVEREVFARVKVKSSSLYSPWRRSCHMFIGIAGSPSHACESQRQSIPHISEGNFYQRATPVPEVIAKVFLGPVRVICIICNWDRTEKDSIVLEFRRYHGKSSLTEAFTRRHPLKFKAAGFHLIGRSRYHPIYIIKLISIVRFA